MTRIERSIEVERSPEQVFEVLCDLRLIPHWATIAGEFEGGPDRPLASGDSFRHTMRVGGLDVKGEWSVTELERPRHVTYEAKADAGGWLKMKQTVVPSDRGSRVELEVDYELPGGFLGDVLDRVYVERRNEREAENSLHNLKALVEGRS